MFSELSLTGYPPEDLLFRADFTQRCLVQLERLQNASTETAIVVGHPWTEAGKMYNALSFSTKENSSPAISNKSCQTMVFLMSFAISLRG